jgi:hypothetical protein
MRMFQMLVFLCSTPAAFADGLPAPSAPNLDKLQVQFAATTKRLVQNMRVVSAAAPQCSFFGSSLTNALQDPINAIPPGAAKIDSSLTKFKTSVAAIGAAPASGVDISGGSARAVHAKQTQILAAVALPETVIDSVRPVVSGGLQKMQQSYAKALGVLQGDSQACQAGTAAFKAVYGDSVTANNQLAAMRAALETQKVALLHWNQGIQTTLGAND